MDEKLRKQLKRITDRPRPRPLMYIGWHNGKKCYIRKRDLTYWQLREKYPPLREIDILPKPRHVFQKKHHMAKKPEYEHIYGYIISASGIAIFAAIVIFYIVLIYRALL